METPRPSRCLLVALLAGPAGEWFNGAVIDYTGGENLTNYSALLKQFHQGANRS